MQSVNSADWAHRFFRDIDAGLRANGVDTTLGIAEPEELGKLWSSYIDAQPAGSVINIFGMNTFPRIDDTSLPPSVAGLNSISWMGDSPAHQIDRMIGLSLSTHLAFVDGGHLELCREFDLNFPMSFLPHGGPAAEEDPLPFAERDIDFLFSGTLEDVPARDDWKRANPGVPDFLGDLIFEAVDILVSSCTTALEAWRACCGAAGFDFRTQMRVEDNMRTLSVIETLAQGQRRKNVLSAIAPERSLHIASSTLPAYMHGRANVHHLGWTEFHELRELFKRTRIVLNPISKFSQGAHERIWYPMAAGAVVATDESRFIAETFAHGQSIVFLPWGNAPDDFRDLNRWVADCDFLESVRAQARDVYDTHHLWRIRAKKIVELLK